MPMDLAISHHQAFSLLKDAQAGGIMDCLRPKGHGPNQDVGNVVSAYTVNEAYALLHPDYELAGRWLNWTTLPIAV